MTIGEAASTIPIPVFGAYSLSMRRLARSAHLVGDEIGDQAERSQGIRRSGVAGDKGMRLAREAVERDRAAGVSVSDGEVCRHIGGQVVIGGALHYQRGGL